LSNTGTAALSLGGITLSGGNAGDFSQANNCGSSVAVGASCIIQVTFTPQASGARSTSLAISDNAAGSPHSAALSGTGVTVPQIALNPASLSFGNQNLQSSSAAQMITLSNTGTAALSLGGITLSGGNAGDFSQANNCGSSVAVGASCIIQVTFTPTVVGTCSASLSVISNAAASPVLLSFSGTGIQLPSWPDASSYWAALVNVTTAVNTYLANHSAYFTNDKIVTDLEANSVNYADSTSVNNAKNAYNQARTTLMSRGLLVGRYISGTNVEPMANEDRYPYSIVPIENMPSFAKYYGQWSSSQPWRMIINVSDAPTRAAFQTQIKQEWQKNPSNIYFLDNAANHEGSTQPWADQCKNMYEINQLAQSMGARAIFNISMLPGGISDTDMNLLVNALNGGGVTFEQPWEAVVSNSATLTANAVKQYRRLLDSGIAVVMIAQNSASQATPAQLKAWVATWRKPSDPLYLSLSFFTAPDPTIYNW
jgi:hypothetical protein